MEGKVGFDQDVALVKTLKSKEIYQDRININAVKLEEVKGIPDGAHLGGERLFTLHLGAENLVKGGEGGEANGEGEVFVDLGDHSKSLVDKIRTSAK